LREAVTRKSAKLSPWELIAGGKADRTQKQLLAKLSPAQKPEKRLQYANTR
jgi:hypothetical protein